MGTPMRYQPQGRVQINWSNPITRGLVFAYSLENQAVGFGEDGRNPFSYVNGSGVTLGVRINTPIGMALQTTPSNNFVFGPTQTSVKSGTYSLFALGTGPSTGMQSALDDDDGSSRKFQFRLNAGKVEFIPFTSTGNGDIISPTALSATDLTHGFTMGATVSGTAAAVYQNGAKTAATLGGAALTPNSIIAVGGRKTNTIQAWVSGGLSLVAMWNRPLSDAEMQSLATTPWQLFDAGSSSSSYQSATIASIPASGGTTDTGSLTWIEDSDVSSLIALVTNRASITWVESNDIHSLVTLITDRAVISYQEDNDIHAISASMSGGSSYLAWTEDNDTYSIQGRVSDLGTLLWTEANDTHTMSGQVYNNVTMSWTESDDTSLITGVVTNFGTMSWTEQNDGVLFLPSNSANGSMRRRKGIHK